MGMLIDIILRVLDRDRPLVIKSWREEDTAVCQEEPVCIREAHVDIPPCTIVTRTLIAEHGTALCTDLGYMHGHIKLFDDADIRVGQLLREVICMRMGFWRKYLGERYQACTHRHGVAVEGAQMYHFIMI